ncbi:MAG: hypothetical protein ACD_11C00115G0002 [uncultured bacterium]|nr:MAG: hypothetical protein ACD_11C00115G0002 [uncultured bacterium]HBR71280.1 threonine dehydratase [Candidatus Moranbacteria bacterium]
MKTINTELIQEAYDRIKDVIIKTPLQLNEELSKKFQAKIYLKREDLQAVRSYKIRGAYNKISSLSDKEKESGVVCASAGNHAQGVAFSCNRLKIKGNIFMPSNTPNQKIERVRKFGGKWTNIIIAGDTFDETCCEAEKFCKKNKAVFIHPFDDVDVIAGQGTIGIEVFEQLSKSPDYIIAPIGGGGLISGLGIYAKNKNPKLELIGVEPEGAPSMSESIKAGKVVTLGHIDKFVDGTAVKTVGKLGFEFSQKLVDDIFLVSEGRVCQEMISLYQNNGIVTEPAGALASAVLEKLGNKIKNKTVVCIVSGGNNDISRYPEVIDRSLAHQGLKHYFIIEFFQKAGSLRKYLNEALGANDDIVLFDYFKKNNRETGPALVGIELSKREDLHPLMKRMDNIGLKYQIVDRKSPLLKFIL